MYATQNKMNFRMQITRVGYFLKGLLLYICVQCLNTRSRMRKKFIVYEARVVHRRLVSRHIRNEAKLKGKICIRVLNCHSSMSIYEHLLVLVRIYGSSVVVFALRIYNCFANNP